MAWNSDSSIPIYSWKKNTSITLEIVDTNNVLLATINYWFQFYILSMKIKAEISVDCYQVCGELQIHLNSESLDQ